MLFAMIHLLSGTVLAGVLVTAVLATPQLAAMSETALPVSAAIGFLAAFPVAWFVTRAIRRNSKSA